MKKCRIGFCGTGKWVSTHHVPQLMKKNDRYEITGFYDVFHEKAGAEAAKGGWKAFNTLDELARDPDTDVVVIATKPVGTHYENALTLLKAGKAVILEKPMTYSSAECDELIAVAQKNNILFTVHHNLRCSICLKASLEAIRGGAVGEPVLVDIDSPRSWYDNIDFSNYAAHMVDQALAINRSPLKEVTACFVHPDEPMGSCGYGDAFLRFEKPPSIRVTIKPLPKKQLLPDEHPFRGYFRFSVFGSKDTFAIDDLSHIPTPEEFTCKKYFYFDNEAPDFSRPEFIASLGKDYYDFFYETWAFGKPLLVSPEEGRNAIRCIELMNESARLNRTVAATNMLPARSEQLI